MLLLLLSAAMSVLDLEALAKPLLETFIESGEAERHGLDPQKLAIPTPPTWQALNWPSHDDGRLQTGADCSAEKCNPCLPCLPLIQLQQCWAQIRQTRLHDTTLQVKPK